MNLLIFNALSWEQRKLGELGKARSGIGFPDAEQGGKEGVPFYKVSDMNNVGNEHEMVAANNYVTREQIDRKGWKPIDEVPAIFFAKVGAAVLLNRKRLCRFPFLLDNNTMAYSIDESALDADFAITLFDTIDLTSLVQVGALPSYNSGDVENIDVVIPEMGEQRKIGAYFKRINSLITLHQSKAESWKNKKNQLSTISWEQRKLGELSSSFEYGLNAAAKEYDGENKYIRITDIDDDSREFKQEDITSPDTDISSADNYRLSEGDILFARTGASVGKSYIYKASDGLVYYAGFLIRARIKPEYNSEFVFQNTLTGDYEKFIKVTSMRSGQPGVNAQEYSQYQIMVPSKPEQDKISDCLRNLDHLITLHHRKLNRTQICINRSFLYGSF